MFKGSHLAIFLTVVVSIFCVLPAEEDYFTYKAPRLAKLTVSERQNYKKKKNEAYQQIVEALRKDEKPPAGEPANLTRVKGTIQIFAKDIKKGGLRIEKPGSYYLSENILFNSSTPGSAALIINSSNVVLDLNGHSIRQAGKKTDTIGIVISNNCNHVEIKNGTIENFSGSGIRVFSKCNNLAFDKINIVSCGSEKGGVSSGGLIAVDANNLSISNSKFLMNSGAAISLLACTYAEIDQISCSETQGTTIPFAPFKSGTTSWGLLAIFPQQAGADIRVSNSSFSGCRGSFNSSGIVILDNQDNDSFLENCICFDIQNKGENLAGREAIGIDVSGNRVELKKCIVNYIKNSAANGYATDGIAISAQNMLIEDCHASDIEATAFFGPHGFYVEKSDLKPMDVHFHRCIASNVKNLEGNPAAGFWFSDGLDRTQPPGNSALAMELDIDSCIAEYIKSYSQKSGSGFIFSSQISLLMQNCVSNGNDIGILVNDSGTTSVVGKITNNKISNNSCIGIQDKSTSKNFLYFSNILQSNAENFSGVPARPPINWPVPAQPGKTDNEGTENGIIDPLDNINIKT